MIGLDWIAGFFELAGLWLVGNKKRWGFILNLLCNMTWIAYVLISKSAYGLLLVVFPAVIINSRNFIKWTKDKNKGE